MTALTNRFSISTDPVKWIENRISNYGLIRE